LNEDCLDYGKKDKGNIRVKERYGAKNRLLLRCNTCKCCLSETGGTIFFRPETLDEEILKTLAMIHEKGSIRVATKAREHELEEKHLLF